MLIKRLDLNKIMLNIEGGLEQCFHIVLFNIIHGVEFR